MAGLDCSKIKTGFTNQVCGKPAIAGTTARVILLSYSDVDKSKSVVTDNVISSLILKAGATGYEVDSLPNATVGSDTINAGTYLKTHQHNVVVRIFKKSEAAKKFVNGLTNARVIAIVENNDTGDNGDTKYEVYGWDSGLELTEITVTTEMTDGVAYQVTLANGTIAQEGSLPMSLFNTDEKTTDLMVDGLLAGGTECTVPAILRFYPAEGQAKLVTTCHSLCRGPRVPTFPERLPCLLRQLPPSQQRHSRGAVFLQITYS